MMIIDPDNDNQAIDETDGKMSYAFRFLPDWKPEDGTPTIEDFKAAPIIGYGRLHLDEGMHF